MFFIGLLCRDFLMSATALESRPEQEQSAGLVAHRRIETVPQCDRASGDRGNVEALLTQQYGTDDAANEPHAYRNQDVRFHRSPSWPEPKRSTPGLKAQLFTPSVCNGSKTDVGMSSGRHAP